MVHGACVHGANMLHPLNTPARCHAPRSFCDMQAWRARQTCKFATFTSSRPPCPGCGKANSHPLRQRQCRRRRRRRQQLARGREAAQMACQCRCSSRQQSMLAEEAPTLARKLRPCMRPPEPEVFLLRVGLSAPDGRTSARFTSHTVRHCSVHLSHYPSSALLPPYIPALSVAILFRQALPATPVYPLTARLCTLNSSSFCKHRFFRQGDGAGVWDQSKNEIKRRMATVHVLC